MPSTLTVSNYLPQFLIVGSVLLLILIVLMSMRSKMAKRRPNEQPRQLIDRVREEAEKAVRHADPTSASTTQELVEYEQTVRRLTAQIETKIVVLETLINQADKRITLLNQTLDQLPGASISPAKINTETPAPPKVIITTSKPKTANHNGTAVPTSITNEPPPDPLSTNVCELHDRGRTPIEIAQYLNEQVGKIELILALRNHNCEAAEA